MRVLLSNTFNNNALNHLDITAGLSAAYLLNRKEVDVTILEASDTYGGRIESDKNFADFTIFLGAEWLHTTGPVLEVNHSLIYHSTKNYPIKPNGLLFGVGVQKLLMFGNI